jgi:hypothetical protein
MGTHTTTRQIHIYLYLFFPVVFIHCCIDFGKQIKKISEERNISKPEIYSNAVQAEYKIIFCNCNHWSKRTLVTQNVQSFLFS